MLCGTVLTQLMSSDPGLVFASLEAARIHDLPRLEDACCRTFALHIDEMCEMEEFPQLVLDDAMAIKGRQQTDSIPLVDDIRHHITQLFGFVPARENYDDGENKDVVQARHHVAANGGKAEEKDGEYAFEDEDGDELFLVDSEAFRRHKVLDRLLDSLQLAGTQFRDRTMEM